MPRIPGDEGRRIGISPAAPGVRLPAETAAAPGRALAEFGRGLSGFAMAEFGREQKIRQQERVKAVNGATLDMTRWLLETKQRYEGDPDYETWRPRFEAEAKAFGKALLERAGGDPEVRAAVDHLFSQKAMVAGFELGGRAQRRRVDLGRAQTMGAVEALQEQAAATLNPVEQRDLEAGLELALTGGVRAGFLTEVEAERRRQGYRDAVEKGRRQAGMDAATSYALSVDPLTAVRALERGETGDPELDAVLADLPLKDRRQALNLALSFRTRRRTAERAEQAAADRQRRLAAEQIQRDLAWEEDPQRRARMLESLRDVGGMKPDAYRRLIERELDERNDPRTNQDAYLKLEHDVLRGEGDYDEVVRAYAEGELSIADRNRLQRMIVADRNGQVASGRRLIRDELKANPMLYWGDPNAMPQVGDVMEEYDRKVRADPKVDPLDVAREIVRVNKERFITAAGMVRGTPEALKGATELLSSAGYLRGDYDATLDAVADALADGEIDEGEALDFKDAAETLRGSDRWPSALPMGYGPERESFMGAIPK